MSFMKILYRWFFRKRLRLTLIGDYEKIHEPAIELHTQKLQFPEFRYMDFLQEELSAQDHPLKQTIKHNGKVYTSCDFNFHEFIYFGFTEKSIEGERTLPVLALNEVYIGELLSSRVSYLEVKFSEDPWIKTRNSGLCISTGTGSTSWTFNINKLTHQCVESILKIVNEVTRFPINFKDTELLEAVTNRFNNDLVFDPELNLMTYTLRDPVSAGTFPDMAEKKPRGKAKRIEVKSRCFDACLVVDGSLSYKFNDGTRAIIELKDEDALRTVQPFIDD